MLTALESVPGGDTAIRKMVVEQKITHSGVSEALKRMYPSVTRGFSSRSVRRYCGKHGIHATSRFEDGAVDRIVRTGIQKVR